MNQTPIKKLIVLVADLDMEYAIRGLLERRSHSIQMTQLSENDYDIFRHPERDPGCRKEAVEYLRVKKGAYQHALVLFDHDGCGCENKKSEEIESEMTSSLAKSGWDNHCQVIVLDPELEIWIWSDSPKIEEILGWKGKTPSLREWMISEGYIALNQFKPEDPKNAMKKALKKVNKTSSASLFKSIAESVGLDRCQDRSFIKLKNTLRKWFPAKS